MVIGSSVVHCRCRILIRLVLDTCRLLEVAIIPGTPGGLHCRGKEGDSTFCQKNRHLSVVSGIARL